MHSQTVHTRLMFVKIDEKPARNANAAVGLDMGVGQNEATRNRTAGFSPWFHLPGRVSFRVPIFDPQPHVSCFVDFPLSPEIA